MSDTFVNDVLDRFFAHYYAVNPVNATFTGVHVHDHALPDWSASGRRMQSEALRALRTELDARYPLPRHPHSRSDAATQDDATGLAGPLRHAPVLVDAELARANIDVRLEELRPGGGYDTNPVLWTGEAILGAVSLMIRPFASVADRLPALRDRLNAVPGFLTDMRACVTGPVPAHWRARAERECLAASQLFTDGLEQWLSLADENDKSAFSDDDNASFGTDAAVTSASLIATSVREAAHRAREAFAACHQWLEAVPPTDESASASSAFGVLLARGHLCDRDPRELLRDVVRELAAAQRRLGEMARELDGNWEEIQARLATDCPTTDSYPGAFTRRWQECRAWVTTRDVVSWPEWPIRYVPIPLWARSAAPQLYWLFYRSPAPFDPYTTYDYLVTPVDDSMPLSDQVLRLRACNHSVITLNHVVHHGSVGHHLQNWHAYHRSRTRIGTIAAVDCASRIGMFLGGSMAEGWACYATDLMDELGFLTPLERVAQQHGRVRMLVRAIVDIRLHAGTLTYAEAVRVYESEVGMSEAAALSEATRNSMFPCTALMYWLGTSGIHALRRELEERRGADFSLRAFHDELLGWGAIPVPLIARLMTEEDA